MALQAALKGKVREGAIRFFTRAIESTKAFRNRSDLPYLERMRRKLTITPSGNYLLDWEHPLLTTRLENAVASKR